MVNTRVCKVCWLSFYDLKDRRTNVYSDLMKTSRGHSCATRRYKKHFDSLEGPLLMERRKKNPPQRQANRNWYALQSPICDDATCAVHAYIFV